jgi:F-type H+-transporting ATPase subunit epsilon
MRLRITTPTAVVFVASDIAGLSAEDASGAFGILTGHADFLTVLETSVVSWRHADGREKHCAVRGGVLTVFRGRDIAVATREAVVSDDLVELETEVVQALQRRAAEEETARTATAKLHLGAIRQIFADLRSRRGAPRRPGALRRSV